MRIIKGTFTLSIGYPGAKHEDDFEIEVDANATDNDIDEILREEWIEDLIS